MFERMLEALAGDALLRLQEMRQRALRDDFAAEFARAGAEVENGVGAFHRLVIVLDDVGYGQLGTFGGPIDTPNIDKLAASGARYANFHTSPLCSPSRASLLTGRHSHQVGMASITEAATGFPGNNATLPRSAATIADFVRELGLKVAKVAVEHNGVIAPRSTLEDVPLAEGDNLEIVHFVGGG